MSKIKTVGDLLLFELSDILSAEKQIHEALPRISQRVTSKELKAALDGHLGETEAQLRRLQMIFTEMKVEPDYDHCSKAAHQLIAQSEESLIDMPSGPALDAAVIGSMQRVEHYEMAAYSSARVFARILGHQRVAELLAKTFAEEFKTDRALANLAENIILSPV